MKTSFEIKHRDTFRRDDTNIAKKFLMGTRRSTANVKNEESRERNTSWRASAPSIWEIRKSHLRIEAS